jgi:hypothetical protein
VFTISIYNWLSRPPLTDGIRIAGKWDKFDNGFEVVALFVFRLVALIGFVIVWLMGVCLCKRALGPRNLMDGTLYEAKNLQFFNARRKDIGLLLLLKGAKDLSYKQNIVIKNLMSKVYYNSIHE